jgi:hypothetical protein
MEPVQPRQRGAIVERRLTTGSAGEEVREKSASRKDAWEPHSG